MEWYKIEFNKQYEDTPFKFQDSELEERYKLFSDHAKLTDPEYKKESEDFERWKYEYSIDFDDERYN